MMDLEALVVAAYVFADEYRVPGRPALTSDAELVAPAVAQAAIGISSDRQFLGLVGRLLPRWFSHLPHQSQYNRRLRALVERSRSWRSLSVPSPPNAEAPVSAASEELARGNFVAEDYKSERNDGGVTSLTERCCNSPDALM